MKLVDLIKRADVNNAASLEALRRALLRRGARPRSAWRCTILLPPMGKPSHRNNGRSTSAGRRWRRGAAHYLLAARPPRIPARVPVRCTIHSIKPRPKSTPKSADPGLLPCPVKPDADNVSKMVKDCCTDARVWHDDAQVVDLRVYCFYAEVDGDPRVIVEVEVIEDARAWVAEVCA